MKKSIVVILIALLVGIGGISIPSDAEARGGDGYHNQHNLRHYRGGPRHHQGGPRHHRRGHHNYLQGIIASGAVAGTLIAIDNFTRRPYVQPVYVPQPVYPAYTAPIADECYKIAPVGYYDQYGQFIRTGQKRIHVNCR